jgi:hypothetical protein
MPQEALSGKRKAVHVLFAEETLDQSSGSG